MQNIFLKPPVTIKLRLRIFEIWLNNSVAQAYASELFNNHLGLCPLGAHFLVPVLVGKLAKLLAAQVATVGVLVPVHVNVILHII